MWRLCQVNKTFLDRVNTKKSFTTVTNLIAINLLYLHKHMNLSCGNE